ncbi:MAG: hypothetical protein CMI53_00240 [Parcubacteria group bacterium]|nr:hypothetical protein [Parcubacteria group bacterium]|tara:strand:- start:13449 stop:14312 length:864 start_codon:yes stop_codon:yes gene_type:complete
MRQKRDYQKKNFRNPFFPKKEKVEKTKRFKYRRLFLIILIIIGSYLLNSSSLLQLENITVKGNSSISQHDILQIVDMQTAKRRFLFFSQNNLLFLKKSTLKNLLEDSLSFDNVSINKNYPDSLEIVIAEKIANLVWVSSDKRYFIGLDGVVLKEATENDLIIQPGEGETTLIRPESSSGKYPIIHHHLNKEVVIGQNVLSAKQVEFIVELTNEIKDRANFKILNYITNDHPQEIILITETGWEARFRLDRSANEQTTLLLNILREKVKNPSELEYIDLRFGEKVFFK